MKKSIKLLVTTLALLSTTAAFAGSLQEVSKDMFMHIKNKENKWDFIGH